MRVADFHSLGISPSLSELLKIDVTRAARRCEKCFNTNGGILSDPVALLTLTYSSTTSVSVTLIMNSAGIGSRQRIGEMTAILVSLHTLTQSIHT